MEKQVKEYGDNLEKADREKIEEDLKQLKELAAKDDVSKEDLDKAIEATMTSSQKIGEAMQKAAAAKAASDTKQSQAEDATGSNDNGSSANKDNGGVNKDTADKKDAQEGEVVKE